MELLLTVLMLAPIGILMWDDKDSSKCKSSSVKKCLLHIRTYRNIAAGGFNTEVQTGNLFVGYP